ncbi:MAG: transcription termination factor Rho [Verrucomicrobiota bacterium]
MAQEDLPNASELEEASPAPKKAAAKKKRAPRKKAAKKQVNAESPVAQSELFDGQRAEVKPEAGDKPQLLYSSDDDSGGSSEKGDVDGDTAAADYPDSKKSEVMKFASIAARPEFRSEEGSPPPNESKNGNSGGNPREESGNRPHRNENHHGGGKPPFKRGKKEKFQPKKKEKFQKFSKSQRKQRQRRRQFEEEVGLEHGNLPFDESLQESESLDQLFLEVADMEALELDFNRLYRMQLNDLRAYADRIEIDFETVPSRIVLVQEILRSAAASKQPLRIVGVFDPIPDSEDDAGMLVYEIDNYRQKALSSYVPGCFVKKFGLQPGHIVDTYVHAPREDESCPFVLKINSIMGRDPEEVQGITPFTELVPYYPTERILLETPKEAGITITWDDTSMRVVDCVSPVGFGQRGLIVAPPRAGKTVLMQSIAHSIQTNFPNAHMMILLVDERPEEVTDFRRQVHEEVEVIASTFDENAESHVHAAEVVIEKARRMVEVGKDVVILLDSITRLARAYNTTMPNSGKILSGGVEANALQKPKRFFGSARNIEGGGSLTILGTALVETGSKMDEVIFEEFKGTGNMELVLDRELVNKRVFPALSFEKSGTRKEELLYHPEEMRKIYSLRRAMKGVPSVEAMEMLIQRIKKTRSNAEFLLTLNR